MYKNFPERLKETLARFFSNRVLVLGVILVPLFAALIVRLFQLQIIRGNEYYEDYVETTTKEVSIPAMRGNIYDRNGKLIAGNRLVYSVTLSDGNYYTKSDGAFNEMILSLIEILRKYDTEIVTPLPIEINAAGEFEYSGSDSAVRRLIRDVYGTDTIEELAAQGEDAYAYDADKVMAKLMTLYNFTSKWPEAADLSKEDVLAICNVRYALSATTYTRYISTAIAEDVDSQVQAAVLESQSDLHGVNIEETYERVYYDSECFSSIIGYVGSITTEEIEELNAEGGAYSAGDIIGKEGVESYYESYLQGTKGKKKIIVDNMGTIMEEEIIEEPQPGNDIYLSVDYDTTVAAYNVMEQQLAGIIVKHLYEADDYDPEVAYESSNYLIPIRDVYFQMINNNILSMKEIAESTDSDASKQIIQSFNSRKTELLGQLKTYLETQDSTPLADEDSYMQAYIGYFYTYLKNNDYLVTDYIDTEDTDYTAWKNSESSFPEFLNAALTKGWIDLSMLNMDTRYTDVETCYTYLTNIILEALTASYGDFDKLVYDELIHEDVITGCQIGRCMIDQGLLPEDDSSLELLGQDTNEAAFSFFENAITNMELLPAQIALDPCSAGLVLTNPNTGELLAVVSYPGYDANRINDSDYYNKLVTDLSSPLYSRATQSRLAPGSTFKMVTATAALEEGYYQPGELIECTGIFDKLDHPKCWIYRLQNKTHGQLDLVHAIGQSCNVFFYELGYRFSTNANNAYSPSLGISVLNKYAALYGFGTLTGIETTENESVLTNELPVTSAIGQGTYAFTTISLARYVTAIASSGNVYEMKLLNHITNSDGDTILSYTPEVESVLEFSDSTWDYLHEGMYTVVHENGSRQGDFGALRKDYAAKSGSAQENRNRAEHGWYVSYGPYDDVEYAMAVQIPYGYGSGNAALISKGVYEYLEGDISLERILENSASSGSVNDVAD